MTMIKINNLLMKMGKYSNSVVIFLIIFIFLIRTMEGANESSIIGQAPNLASKTSDFFKEKFTGNLAALRQGKPKNFGPPPGQYVGMPPGLEEFLKLKKMGPDTYLEPYWSQGEWVFQRQVFTPRPPRYLQLYHKVKPAILQECVEFCPRIYEGYGQVCAHFVTKNQGLLKRQSFANLCHMMLENCINSKSRHYNIGWQPLFHGDCLVRLKKRLEYPGVIANNAKKIIDALTSAEPKQPPIKFKPGR